LPSSEAFLIDDDEDILAGLKALASGKSAGIASREQSAASRSVSAVVTKRIKLKTIPSLIPNVIGNRPVK